MHTPNYKFILLPLLILALNQLSYGQSAQSTLFNISNKNSGSLFFSIQGSYDFSGLNDFTDNLNYSSKLIYNARSTKRLQIPATLYLGQLKSSLQEINNSKSQLINENFGLGIGVHPQFDLIPYNNKLYLNINAGLSWRFNTFQKTLDEATPMNTGRLSASLEFGYNIFKSYSNNRPASLTVTPIVSVFQADDYIALYNSSKTNFNALEVSTNIPLGRSNFAIGGKWIVLDSKNAYLGLGINYSGQLRANKN